MKIAAITRYKNGHLWEALHKVNWSHTDLSIATGISAHHIGRICNLKTVPALPTQVKIASAFMAAGFEFDIESAWPADLKPLERSNVVVQVGEVDLQQLGYEYHQQLLADAPDVDRWEEIEPILNALAPIHRDAVIDHFLKGKTLEEIGGNTVGRERARQIVNAGLRRIRNAAEMLRKLNDRGPEVNLDDKTLRKLVRRYKPENDPKIDGKNRAQRQAEAQVIKRARIDWFKKHPQFLGMDKHYYSSESETCRLEMLKDGVIGRWASVLNAPVQECLRLARLELDQEKEKYPATTPKPA